LIAFCTTCKGRVQHIEQTLPQNLADNATYPDCKFILVDYNSQDHLYRYLQLHHRQALDSGRLVYYYHPAPGPFRMAHAKNMAHRLGIAEGADILVNLDADNFTGVNFAQYIEERYEGARGHFLWARMVQGELPRGINGRIVVTKEAFLKVGGYDERFSTWSPDDKDFNLRLRRLGYRGDEIPAQFLNAVTHTDKMRFREYQHVTTHVGEDQLETVHSLSTTVVNYGDIGCGTVYRNLESGPITLGPVPTRIFGIGMHKTGTTSLHHALRVLGYDSAHWESAHWARVIWEEMRAEGRSSTLERHYALSDLPIPLMYRELDKAYPGSKFILTLRPEADWLASVQNHWSHDHNPYRGSWATDPFTHRVHRELYGQKGFDAELFLGRYRRHNEEVKEYFKGMGREGDLLVLDSAFEFKWVLLCDFLGQPVPTSPYPVAFPTRKKGIGREEAI
jgi:hypothetical protein